ncbi:MAG: ATP-dependent RecD-like DNA helicase [Chitinispirillaceae bacterium]
MTNNTIALTNHQRSALDSILRFLSDPSRNCFILKGSAGTGKTTLIGALSQKLDIRSIPFCLMSPTGRAARILGRKTGFGSRTIHSCIYTFGDLDFYEQAREENDPGMRLSFKLKTDNDPAQVFIVDEASMISDKEDRQDYLRFGSGRLLSDLITYTRAQRSGRSANSKIIFVGDPVQLPPVTQQDSPALSAPYLSQTFGLRCGEHELTQVLRQKDGSPILEKATLLRDAVKTRTFTSLNLDGNGEGLQAVDSIQAVNRITNGPPGKTVLLTYSNASALEYNRAVREKKGIPDSSPRKGDLLLVNQNNPHTGLFNGDLVRVEALDSVPEKHSVKMRGVREPVTLTFRKAVVACSSATGERIVFRCMILENLLDSPNRSLSPLEIRALLVDFRKRNPGLTPKSAQFGIALKSDPYFNALQVKYGYALTCHKSQGGEWDTVAVDFTDDRGKRNESYYRWVYTAITRASRKLLTINAPSFNAFSQVIMKTAVGAEDVRIDTGAGEEEYTRDPDWFRHNFSKDRKYLYEMYSKVREAFRTEAIRVSRIEHLQYQERYVVSKGEQTGMVRFYYRGDRNVTKVEPVDKAGRDNRLSVIASELMVKALIPQAGTGLSTDHTLVHDLISRIEKRIAGTELRLVEKKHTAYCLHLTFEENGKRMPVKCYYDKTPGWTRFISMTAVDIMSRLKLTEAAA